MHPMHFAQTQPDKPAYIMASTGETVTYGELEDRTNQAAQLLRELGCQAGDTVAILLDNDGRYLELTWAAHRAGLYYTCLSSKLGADTLAFILADCGAKLLFTSSHFAQLLDAAAPPPGLVVLTVDGPQEGALDYLALRATMPATRIADEAAGADMLYSSGTTGRPKGVRRPLPGGPPDNPDPLTDLAKLLFGFDADTVYLSPAPLYHAAPLRWCMSAQRLGATVVIMEKFDAEEALALIERYRVTSAQWVPTHFVRMLRLPEDVRGRYDMSSLRGMVHAAAPCPIPVKQAMLDWWGPIITEYYSGTEGFGMTVITAEEWLERPGSVGRALLGQIHICDDDGEELPIGSDGVVYFSGGEKTSYHNDPEKSAGARNRHGWGTYGDIGRVDEAGYLTLTDRKNFTIISGGVNVYPQEIENLLVSYEAVMDAAVFGIPDEELGEQVVAVVQLLDPELASEQTAQMLRDHVRARLGGIKTPRRLEFSRELPRQASGKLFKLQIRDEMIARDKEAQNG